MQQQPTSANCSTTVETAADLPGLAASLKPGHSTVQRACCRGPNARTAAVVAAQTEVFLLPGPDEVVRRVWHCERDGQYVVHFFDIWQSELAEHFAYRIYEADTLTSITHSRHSIQAGVPHLLVQTELVPVTASIPFVVRTGSQVDRAERWSAIK